MLSRKVTCAILVLNELYESRLDTKTESGILRRATLAEHCSLGDSLTFRRVIQQLRQSKYIGVVAGKSALIKLTCDPTELTIYELFVVLHGGIPLGEEVGHKRDEDYNTDARYSKIKLLEADVTEVSRKYFERRTVASMISKKSNYSKRNIDNE